MSALCQGREAQPFAVLYAEAEAYRFLVSRVQLTRRAALSAVAAIVGIFKEHADAAIDQFKHRDGIAPPISVAFGPVDDARDRLRHDALGHISSDAIATSAQCLGKLSNSRHGRILS